MAFYSVIDPRFSRIIKKVDEIVNNSDVLQDDDELFFPMVAGSGYVFYLAMTVFSVTGTPDLQFNMTLPAGADIVGKYTENTSVGNFSGSTVSAISLSSGGRWVVVECWVDNPTNAGDMQLQWAQSTTTAENVTVKKGSYIIWQKVY